MSEKKSTKDETIKMYDVTTEQMVDFTVETDVNQEVVLTAPSGHFVKFPNGTRVEQAVKEFNEAHGQK